VEPIPETADAIEEFGPFMPGDGDGLSEIKAMADRVRRVVPECVGMSLAMISSGVTLTLVATDEEIAALDGVQYATDGPCVRGVDVERVVEYRASDVLDEDTWRIFAEATAAVGIASTLTLPVLEGDEVIGSVNLYASAAEAFSGREEAVAAVVGGWAPAAVKNADLGFATRRTAQEAPAFLRDDMRIQIAVGIIVASEGGDPETARERLRQAAERAGVSESAVARRIIGRLSLPEDLADEPGEGS
jgi:GAF domain-containing protein